MVDLKCRSIDQPSQNLKKSQRHDQIELKKQNKKVLKWEIKEKIPNYH